MQDHNTLKACCKTGFKEAHMTGAALVGAPGQVRVCSQVHIGSCPAMMESV